MIELSSLTLYAIVATYIAMGRRTKNKLIWKKRLEVATIVYSGKLWKTIKIT